MDTSVCARFFRRTTKKLICCSLPDTLTCDDGALLEPLAVACHAVRRAQIKPGSSCLIIGAGAVGLLCAAAAKFHGCSRIAMCDIDQRRIDFALKNGFAQAAMTTAGRRGANIDEELELAKTLAKDIASLQWPDGTSVGKLPVTFECTGVPSCVQTSIYVSPPCTFVA